MAPPATPPVFLNYLAVGIVAGIAAISPFALSRMLSSVGWHRGLTAFLLSAWAWLAWVGWASFRVRPLPSRPVAFGIWYGAVLFELALLATGVLGWARGDMTARIDVAGALGFFWGWLPALVLLGAASDGTALFVSLVLGPLLLPVAAGTLALLLGLA